MKLFALVLLLLCPSLANAQATWNGKQYNSRVCANPSCGMCASIQTQLQTQVQRVAQVAQRPIQATQAAVQSVGQSVQYRAVTRQVKRCNGRQCWYETVTEYVPVSQPQPIQQSIPKPTSIFQSQPKPVSAPNTLANTELIPTPQVVVDRMIDELKLSASSKFFDLGCGDGRLLIAAAKRHACYTVGVELNPATAALARKRAQNEFVSPLVLVFQGDVRDFDLYEADAVALYLYPDLLNVVVPKLKTGTRIVSYQHEIPGIKQESVSVPHDGQTHVFFVGVK